MLLSWTSFFLTVQTLDAYYVGMASFPSDAPRNLSPVGEKRGLVVNERSSGYSRGARIELGSREGKG
jgi:hypothetical protein